MFLTKPEQTNIGFVVKAGQILPKATKVRWVIKRLTAFIPYLLTVKRCCVLFEKGSERAGSVLLLCLTRGLCPATTRDPGDRRRDGSFLMKWGFENEALLWCFSGARFRVKVKVKLWEDFSQNICWPAHPFLWMPRPILVYLSKSFVHLVLMLMFLVEGELLGSIWKVPGEVLLLLSSVRVILGV